MKHVRLVEEIGKRMKRCEWLLILLAGVCVGNYPYIAAQESQAVSLQADKGHKAKKRASKDDVLAVGTRNIGGKGIGNWYSPEQEIGLGREYSQLVEEHAKLLTDPVVTEYVNRIGQNLVRNSDAKVPFTVKVIDSDEINAFALPGGFLYVNTALLTETQSEAELAGVMAHEIAHVAAHHATRQMTHSQMLTLATIPLIFVGGGVGLAVREAVNIAAPLTVTKFSRSYESEADYLGVEYLYISGYDPQAYISFFERIKALEKEKPGAIAKIFSNHPETQQRIRRAQAEIAKILPPREAYVISTSEFDDVKLHLMTLESRRARDPTRPVLRRSGSADQGDSKENGEQPTLKRQSEQ